MLVPSEGSASAAAVTVMILRVFRGRGEPEITHEHKLPPIQMAQGIAMA